MSLLNDSLQHFPPEILKMLRQAEAEIEECEDKIREHKRLIQRHRAIKREVEAHFLGIVTATETLLRGAQVPDPAADKVQSSRDKSNLEVLYQAAVAGGLYIGGEKVSPQDLQRSSAHWLDAAHKRGWTRAPARAVTIKKGWFYD